MATTTEVRRCTRLRSEPMRGRTVLERDSMSTTRNTRKESMHYLSHYESPLGAMTMASDGEHLTGLWFDGQKYDRSTISDEAVVQPPTRASPRRSGSRAPTSRRWSPPSCSPSPSAPPAPMLASPRRSPGVPAGGTCPLRPWVARSDTTRSLLSCRATACSPPTEACAVTRVGLTARNGS